MKFLKEFFTFEFPSELQLDSMINDYVSSCTYTGISRLKDYVVKSLLLLVLIFIICLIIYGVNIEEFYFIIDISLIILVPSILILSRLRYIKLMKKFIIDYKTKSVDDIIEINFKRVLTKYKLNTKEVIEKTIVNLERKRRSVENIYIKFTGAFLFLLLALNITELTSLSKMISTNENTAHISRSIFVSLVLCTILYLTYHLASYKIFSKHLFYKTTQINHFIDKLMEEKDKTN